MSARGLEAIARPPVSRALSREAEGTHRFRLGMTEWWLWSDALLRSTGFPATGLDRLAGAACAKAADGYLAGRADQAAFRAAFDGALGECRAELARIAGEPEFREAVTWQDPALLPMLDSLATSGADAPRNSKRREREHRVARFWQRYCAKTETIGFFGPSLWITLDPGASLVTAVAGDRLVDVRRVFVEPWAVIAYGAKLAEDPSLRAWLPPVLQPHYYIAGSELRRPGLPPMPLKRAELAALSRCNGRSAAVEIVTALASDPSLGLQESDAFAMLNDLAERRLLRWDANLPMAPVAEQLLEERIAAIRDAPLRTRALSGLAALRDARDAVAAAAGDAEALARALARMDDEFTRITGQAPRRRHGQVYAGRGLCYEDATRDLRLVVGRRFLDDLAPSLAIMLQVARWTTSELARRYAAALRGLVRDLQSDRDGVTLAEIWDRAIELLTLQGPKGPTPMADVLAELDVRFESLFELSLVADAKQLELTSAELASRVAELFPVSSPGWSWARIHSPDLQLCARSPEAINDGEYIVVLGETHIAHATLTDSWCNWSRPSPSRMLELMIQDFGRQRFVPLLPVTWSKDAGRSVQITEAASDRCIGFARAAGVDRDRLVPAGTVRVVADDDTLVGLLPSGERVPLLEFFAFWLSAFATNAIRDVAQRKHTPRISIDRLVVFRETWRPSLADLEELVAAPGDPERYLAARRLVGALALPERCFVRISTERKPFYVDFTSPIYVGMFASMLRSARESARTPPRVTISEMLPAPDQAWVPAADGARYFGEVRVHVTDDLPAYR